VTTYRSLTLRGALNGTLRTATFREREHIVVPVVALVEGVVHAVNAAEPELVLASEFSRAPDAWNGEPVMLDHPDINGQKVSANSPEILEARQLGQVFHTSVDGTRLLMEAYIDPSRVDAVGEQAQELLATLQAGGVVEVSVGAFVTAEKATGTHKGRAYTAVWRDIVPDHLALLPTGATGACSVEAGCGAGAPRAATVHLVTAEGISFEEEPMPMPGDPEAVQPRTLRERIKDMIQSFRVEASVEDMSDLDMRRALDTKLRSVEPAYLGIDAVFPADNLVIYAVNPEDRVQVFKRTFALGDTGDVSLEERVEVEPVTRYEPVAAEAAPRAAACGCQKVNNSAVSATKEPSVHKNAERITALIANPKTPWTELDRAHLETQADERLTTLETVANTEPAAPVTKELTLADLPEHWRKAIEAQAAAEVAAKTEQVAALAAAQSVYTQAELETLSVAELKKLSALAGLDTKKPVDFSARAAAVRAAAGDEGAPPAPDFNARFAARK